MRRFLRLAMMSGAFCAVSPVAAQTAPAPAPSEEPSVDAYLCTFAGKCGADAQEAGTVTRDAPPTKGFSLARPQSAPPATEGFSLSRPTTKTAPPTKGFSLTRPQIARPQSGPAPTTRGFSLAKSKSVPTNVMPVAVRGRTPARRNQVAAAASAPAPILGAMTPRRADLMISFEVNSDRLTTAGEARARVFADSMLRPELLDRRFLISGHTDAVGGRSANLELSRRRAQAVAEYLKAAGVAPTRLEVRGMGYQAPLPGHKASDPANRRVEAELVS